MSEHVQCTKCYEVREKKEVKENGGACPDCQGKDFRDS